MRGRFFNEEDDEPGGPSRVVLTYGYWQRRFGGAENVIGQLLEIDGTPAEIIGVLPSSFKIPGHRCRRVAADATRSRERHLTSNSTFRRWRG